MNIHIHLFIFNRVQNVYGKGAEMGFLPQHPSRNNYSTGSSAGETGGKEANKKEKRKNITDGRSNTDSGGNKLAKSQGRA